MMTTLIGLGAVNGALRTEVEASLGRLGAVAFDPGQTACAFPDPLPYLEKMWGRKKPRHC